MAEVKGRLRKSLSKWASSADMEARELKEGAVKAGCCPIAEADDRQRVELQGSLRTVTLRPRGGVPALEAELYDGSALITLVWLGRRRIAGIEPGRAIKVDRPGRRPGQDAGDVQPALRAEARDRQHPAARSGPRRSSRSCAPSCPRRSAAGAACSRPPYPRSPSRSSS